MRTFADQAAIDAAVAAGMVRRFDAIPEDHAPMGAVVKWKVDEWRLTGADYRLCKNVRRMALDGVEHEYIADLLGVSLAAVRRYVARVAVARHPLGDANGFRKRERGRE